MQTKLFRNYMDTLMKIGKLYIIYILNDMIDE